MSKIFKTKDGAALLLIIVVSTILIILLTSLISYAYISYRSLIASNTKSNSYYISDYGMEKTIKNIEIVVESARIYADEMVMGYKDPAFGGITALEYYGHPDQVENYKEKYMDYYIGYLDISSSSLGKLSTTITGDTAVQQLPLNSMMPQALIKRATYKSTIKSIDDVDAFKDNPVLKITVEGYFNDAYNSETVAEISIDPFNTESGNNTDIIGSDLHKSPQWSNALASSGDIITSAGNVTIDGNVFVNGYEPLADATTGQAQNGDKYGGLVVNNGNLTVKGNIYSSNYVHVKGTNSTLNIAQRDGIANYADELKKIYHDDTNPSLLYSEKASDLGSDPLGIIGKTLGGKQVFSNFIDLIKYTKDIQDKIGGFVYANCLQIENGATNSSINVDGSAIVYDNIEADDGDRIYLKNQNSNFYGFNQGDKLYNQSSSIIINSPRSKIQIGGRVYAGGTAYVTAFKDNGGTPDIDTKSTYEPYRTGEAASIYKNYYAYRENLPSFGTYDAETYTQDSYPPFKFIELLLPDKIRHAFAYDAYTSDTALNPEEKTISEGGTRYDKNGLVLNGNIYDINKIYKTNPDNASDMGYSAGVLMGATTTGGEFIGYINRGATDPTNPFYKDANNSLSMETFGNYIADKYSTLMTIRTLKSKNIDINEELPVKTGEDDIDYSNEQLTIHDLVADIPDDTFKVVKDSSDNYAAIIADGDILLEHGSGDDLIARFYDHNSLIEKSSTTVSTNGVFNGIIYATGKITVNNNTSRPTAINGTIISSLDIQSSSTHEGIIFTGTGNITVKYDINRITEIFRQAKSNADLQILKDALTSRTENTTDINEGTAIYRAFKRIYKNQEAPGAKETNFYTSINSYMTANGKTYQEAIRDIASMYESHNDIISLVPAVVKNLIAEKSKNFKILSWENTKG